MSDIFREVDEEYRQERTLETLRKYSPLIIAGVASVCAVVFGWRYWETQRDAAAEAANVKFASALKLMATNKPEEADRIFADVRANGPKGYSILANFAGINALALTDRAAAVNAYDSLAQSPSQDELFRAIAQLRAAQLRADEADRAEMETRLKPLAAGGAPFRASARELLALSAMKAGDSAAAMDWLAQIVSDVDAPQGLRQRAEAFLSMLRADEPSSGSRATK